MCIERIIKLCSKIYDDLIKNVKVIWWLHNISNELYMKLKEARKLANIDLLILNLVAVAE